jgi:hypothetical protein
VLIVEVEKKLVDLEEASSKKKWPESTANVMILPAA